jgi:hypothetical protein
MTNIGLFALLMLFSAFATGQIEPDSSVFHPNQEVRIRDLPLHSAQMAGSNATLAAALETVFRDSKVCCGSDSALQSALSAEPQSLKDLGAKLQGRHFQDDGRLIAIAADYLPADSTNPDQIIAPLMGNQPLLMQWNKHFYVLYGAIFDETVYYSGRRDRVIHKLLLLDPRSSSTNKQVLFDRQKDDWTQVQGLLILNATRP